MTWRSDSAQLFSGKWLSSAYPGYGIKGSAVPSAGQDGASPLYDNLDPGDENKEYRIVWLTPPSSGTFTTYEDTSVALTGAANGSYTAVGRIYENDIDRGTETVTITVGSGSISITVTGIEQNPDVGSCTVTLSGSLSISVAGAENSPDIGACAVNFDGVTPPALVVPTLSDISDLLVQGGLPMAVANLLEVLLATNPVTIEGTQGTGQQLTARLAPGYTVTGYQWTRNGVDIPGATGNAYTQQLVDIHTIVSVRVSGVSYQAPGIAL